MKRLFTLAISAVLAACQTPPAKLNTTPQLINDEMKQATAQRKAIPLPAEVGQALLVPQIVQQPAAPKPVERRFNISVSNAPAAQVFAAIASDSQYNIVVHPEVTGSISLNLRNVTLQEAMETIREVYGYEFRVQGNRVTIYPLTLQTRIFQVNYLNSSRAGRSDTRVVSGSILASNGSSGGGTGSSAASGTTPGAQSGSGQASVGQGSVVSTEGHADFWAELNQALKMMAAGEGRSVVTSPQAGTIIVRAMPRELREIENYLKLSRLSLERQVMLEAKIVEVILNDGYQNGINWMAFGPRGHQRLSTGADARQIALPSGRIGEAGQVSMVYNEDTGVLQPNTLGDVIATPIVGSIAGQIANSPLSSVLGLAFSTDSFSAILSFLETQGNIHVLSSPRIATMNNQKAVLKVGSDDYFVTNITTTTTSSATGNTTSPTINLQAFFSGISLDVTPQIDDQDNVMLHVRPSVSVVTERNKQINLGTAGVFNLPLASSRTNETDSIVRVREGNIVAIGGLMEQAQTADTAKVPGVGDVPVVNQLFSQGRHAMQKRELVVLMKATIIRGDADWQQDLNDTAGRLSRMEPQRPQ